jgi:hypothetical protein
VKFHNFIPDFDFHQGNFRGNEASQGYLSLVSYDLSMPDWSFIGNLANSLVFGDNAVLATSKICVFDLARNALNFLNWVKTENCKYSATDLQHIRAVASVQC